ncbi:hypothetical protein [Planctomicrobium sp. SH527]|uniref:hypothetical protein n=1 Tax=Planctomicrobium sp. SH527 TaxID=3448123 RepID=UPI003F5C7B7E
MAQSISIRVTTAIGLLLLFVGGLFVSPGLRHSHEGGDRAHSHSHSHSHSHGHHHHSHGGNAHSHGEDVGASHIHISFLWFGLTLSDFFGSQEAVADSSARLKRSKSSSVSEVVELQRPGSLHLLILVVLFTTGLLSGRGRWGIEDGATWHSTFFAALKGRLPDAPDTPPPKLT